MKQNEDTLSALRGRYYSIKTCIRAAISVKTEGGGAVRCEDKPKYIVNENTHEFMSTRRRTYLYV